MDSPFSQGAKIPTEGQPISNARLVAELQALTLGIHLVGLERLPEVMRPYGATIHEGTER